MQSYLLIDLNQIILAPLMREQIEMEESLVKHLAINSLRANVKKFKEYSTVILCSDSRNYWRKKVFPFYKAHRKENRKKSSLDWDLIFRVLNELKVDLQEYFPYKFVEIDGAEADDVIATLVEFLSPNKICIISSDADFKQLHAENIKQYNPLLDVYIKCPNPILELKTKVIKGDPGDGIPNILSKDDVFITKKRQSPITQKKLDVWTTEQDLKNILTEDQYRNYMRNNLLINLSMIPQDIKFQILHRYETYTAKTKHDLYKYLVSNKMIRLLDCIEDF